MSTYASGRPARTGTTPSPAVRVHLSWLAAGLALGFAVPFVLADVAGLQRDVYYGLYSAFAVGLFVLWARTTGQSLAGLVRRRWAAAVALGVGFAVVLAVVVVRAEDATTRLDGFELVGAIVWRGLVYGAADGVLLSAFPILVVFAAFAASPLRRRPGGTIAVGLLALLASLAMTAAYHAGYSDFRSGKLRNPVAGDVAWSVPTLLTLNPVGAPIAHAGMHTAAVLHSPGTDLFLPPHR